MNDIDTFQKDSSLECLLEGLDVSRLISAIYDQPELWRLNTWRQDEAGGQQDTEAIMLRWAKENNFASVRDSVSVVQTKQMIELSESHPLLNSALEAIDAKELGRVFIVRLKSGGRVYPHSDVGMYADKFERFHLCLQADQGFRYFVQHPTGPVQSCNMKPGELWWFNHKRVHWAYNGGARDRITIIIDAVSHKWKRNRDQLAIGVGYKFKEEKCERSL